jgi:hypothetical protein
MHIAKVLPLHSELKLPERFNERHALNIADGASKL